MRGLSVILFLISFSSIAQKDLLVLDGIRYQGRLIEYSNYDIRDKNSGNVIFYINKWEDTLEIKSGRNFRLKIRKDKNYFDFKKKTWNNIELGFSMGIDSYTNVGLFFAKGLVNEKFYNVGIGTGIFNLDRINFIPFYFKNFYDFPVIGRSLFKPYIENNIGYSLGEDLGNQDYISAEGGFFFNPSIGIKKSSGRKHMSLKIGYLLQRYSSTHNNIWWGWWSPVDISFPGQNIVDDIISRDGSFKRMTLSFSVFF